MVITFLIMCNKNQFFDKKHENYKNINLNILLAKNKYKKTLLTYNKTDQKMIMNLYRDYLRCYSSAYSGSFY